MEIIYLISLIILSTSFFILKKSNEKLNAITWLAMTIVLTMCYNIFVVFVLSACNVHSTLTTLFVVNIIFILGINYKNYKNKKLQEYFITKSDVFFSLLILLSVVIITVVNFKFDLCLKYKSVDSASHYTAAREFWKNSILLNKVEKTTIFNYETHMPATYINIGILFKIFAKFIGEINLHKIYMLFDMFMLFTIGLVFYSLISNKIKGKFLNIVGAIFVVLFMIGYPLNTIIYGFSYLTFNLIILTAILKIIPYYSTNKIYDRYLLPITFLLTFAVFFSYYFFAPVVYASIFIYMIIVFKKQGKVITLKNILKVVMTLVIPTILGFLYFVLPGIIDDAQNNMNALNAEGTMYRDAYSNFLFFIHFIAFYIIEKIKNKEFKFEIIFTALLLCFMLVLFIGGIQGRVSSYYYFKNHYVLWILSLYMAFKGFYILSKEKNSKIFSRNSTYFILCNYCWSCVACRKKNCK